MNCPAADSTDVDLWISQLVLAGWIEKSHTFWISPDGSVWRGPYCAWREMLRRKAEGGTQDA